MTKRMILFPTFDGQTMGAAAIDPEAIHMVKAAVMPGTSNVYVDGDQTVNAVGVYMDISTLVKKLESVGIEFIDLGGAANLKLTPGRQDDH